MSLQQLDLNLMRVLQALVRCRSVTLAAAALSLSQPQVSRSLARLRRQTGDALLVRAGNAMEPTDVALGLARAFDTAFAEASVLLGKNRIFDAASSDATFRISMNDYEAAVLLPPLADRLQREAPGIRLAVVSHRPKDIAHALLGARVELAIGRFSSPAQDLRSTPLFAEKLVAVTRKGHPLLRRPTLAAFAAYPHVLVSPGGDGDFHGLLDEKLAAAGLSRRVFLSVSQFLMAPAAIGLSDAVALMPARLLPTLANLGLRAVDVGLELPAFQVCMLWRERSHRDPAHQWLRRLVRQAAA